MEPTKEKVAVDQLKLATLTLLGFQRRMANLFKIMFSIFSVVDNLLNLGATKLVTYESMKCLPLQWNASVVGTMAMDVLGGGSSLPVTMETLTDYVNKFEVFHQHLYVSSLKTSFDISYYRDFDEVKLY